MMITSSWGGSTIKWRVKWRNEPGYRVGFTGPYSLEYQDDQATVKMSTEMAAKPSGYFVDIPELPADFHLTREELVWRVWSVMSDKRLWGPTLTFWDKKGNQLPTPTRRAPRRSR
jgi:hypothetical protein